MSWKPRIELCKEAAAAGFRQLPGAYYQDLDGGRRQPYPTGPNGRPLCRWCGNEIPAGSRRRRYCSEACDDEFSIRLSASYAAALVERRDKEVCARCGLDIRELRAVMHEWESELRAVGMSLYVYLEDTTYSVFLALNGLRDLNHWWEAHHKIAVSEGGGCCGLDGLETLCRRCHSKETSALARRLNRRKRARKQPELFGEEVMA